MCYSWKVVIPYFQIPSLFGLIHAFGVLVASGILLGAWLTGRRSRQLQLDPNAVSAMLTWVVVAGFLMAHFFDVLAYQPREFLERPWLLIDPRHFSISSFGGFFGGYLGLALWAWRNHQPQLPYADSLAFGMAPAWVFGRLGCFVAHDHPGRQTDFFLAVQYPGGARHDLGLYEAIFAILLSAVFFLVFRRKLRTGVYLAVLCLAYAPVRFFLDFLRATEVAGADPRYLGLTPAQYGSIALVVLGVALVWRIAGKRPATST
jgi:phosphatidylglycerol---prolipoprotein diacylglyceryl transferase